MSEAFEQRLAKVIQATLVAGSVGLAPVVLAGCDSPVFAAARCDDVNETHITYLLVDEGDACPAADEVSVDDLSQLGCACPVIDPVVVCEDSHRVNAPLDGVGEEIVGKDACGYRAVGNDTGVCCGRPLLRDAEPVVASVASAHGWDASDTTPVLAGLSAAERAALADYWREVALLEHASVASFARFTLALMEHGAPSSLLSQAQQAGMDEVRHARAAFALASAYAGSAVAPGAMNLAGTQIVGTSLVELAVACVHEGCIGETIASVEAAHRLVGSTDPAVRATLSTIVEDEGRHASMAWQALAWMLSKGDATLLAAVDEAFSQAPNASGGADDVGAAAGHGLIGRRARDVAVQQAWNEVIQPAWAALRASC